MPRIIADIDGTVLDSQEQPIVRVVNYLKAEAEEIVFLTNRAESERERTIQELDRTGLSYEALIMNDTGEAAPAFKKSKVKEMLDAGEAVDEFIDNNPDNRAAVAELGVKVVDPADISEADDEKEEEAKTTKAKAKRGRKSNKLTVSGKQMASTEEQLLAALAQVTAANGEKETLAKSVTDLTEKAAAFEVEKEKLAGEIATLSAALAAATEKVAGLEAAAKTAEEKATATVAACAAVPAEISAEAPKVNEKDVVAVYDSLTGQARIDFLNANKKAIWAAKMAR